MSLPKQVTATIYTTPDHDKISLSAKGGQAREILLSALQDKHDFLQLVHRFQARVVLCVDGQLYFLPASSTDAFLVEVGRLVDDYIPEIHD